MKVDNVLILAAGKGTRMGVIGEELPKVLWPVFEKSILELEILYARSLVPNANIFINCYNYRDKIEKEAKVLQKQYNFELVIESEVLDIGGAIHNLAQKLNYRGNLLVINSDQFLFFEESVFPKSLELLKKEDVVLYSYKVNSNDGYNALDIHANHLQKIIPNKEIARNTPMLTYSGMSLIKLESLDKIPGESKYFETVANPRNTSVQVINLDDLEYWDFGTIQRYYDSITTILKNKECRFYEFLNAVEAIDEKHIRGTSYNSNSGINLSSHFIENCYNSIVLEVSSKKIPENEKLIIKQDLHQPV